MPIDLSDNCYLIHHRSEGYLLWDTGSTDLLSALPEGQAVPAIGQTWYRRQTLVAALGSLGVKPADVHYIAISHVHPDHSGNVDELPEATVIMQKAEWDYALTLPQRPFSPEHKRQLTEGDKDLFGDGSLVILSTPGHTPGHQSLLVHLDKTGYVVLSGDVVHFEANWDERRVPSFNTTKPNRLLQWKRSRGSWTRSTRSSGSTTTSRRATLDATCRNSTSSGVQLRQHKRTTRAGAEQPRRFGSPGMGPHGCPFAFVRRKRARQPALARPTGKGVLQTSEMERAHGLDA